MFYDENDETFEKQLSLADLCILYTAIQTISNNLAIKTYICIIFTETHCLLDQDGFLSNQYLIENLIKHLARISQLEYDSDMLHVNVIKMNIDTMDGFY